MNEILPITIAGRIQFLMGLYLSEVLDAEGNLVGYEETGIITKEKLLELLNFPLDNM